MSRVVSFLKISSPGTYALEAEHLGFIRSLLADSAGTTVKLRLAAGEMADMNLKLAPPAAIIQLRDGRSRAVGER
jgi:hypothetical protein